MEDIDAAIFNNLLIDVGHMYVHLCRAIILTDLLLSCNYDYNYDTD